MCPPWLWVPDAMHNCLLEYYVIWLCYSTSDPIFPPKDASDTSLLIPTFPWLRQASKPQRPINSTTPTISEIIHYLCCQGLVQDTIVSPRCLHQLFSSFSNPHPMCCLLPTLFSHQAVRVNLVSHKLTARVALEWNPHFRLARPS